MYQTSELSTFAILAFGFVLGLHHATEADHLAAISTIISEKKNLLTASLVGGLWGIGHTLSLFVVGIWVILLKFQLSETVQTRLEAVVGFMLVILGLNALVKIFRVSRIHVHTHQHDGRVHSHIHAHHGEHEEISHHRLSPRSLVVGMVHGLAGSGALMFIVVPTISSSAVAIFYVVVFGLGSIGGMMAMSLLIGLPFHFTSGRFNILNKLIGVGAGCFSLVLGVSIIYQTLFAA
jgi:sulfite exporter TauE/SafE